MLDLLCFEFLQTSFVQFYLRRFSDLHALHDSNRLRTVLPNTLNMTSDLTDYVNTDSMFECKYSLIL